MSGFKYSLHTNRYLPSEVQKPSLTTTTKENFKQYYEKRNTNQQKQRLLERLENNQSRDHLGSIPQHLLSTTDYQFKKFPHQPNDLLSTNKIDFNTSTDFDMNPKKEYDQRYIQPTRTLVHIDSRNRDTVIYPKQNRYRIRLNKTFQNIKRIALRSTEFPNSVQLIRSTPILQANNKIFWQNEGDSTIFSAELEPGNYQPNSLATEIQNKMNSVLRTDGTEHNFRVSIDTVTDTVTFNSFDISVFTNVLNIRVAEQGIITVDLGTLEHGFDDGDIIEVSGGLGFGNIPSSEVNGTKTITVIDDNTFTYTISSIYTIVEDTLNGGGNVQFAKGTNFKLLFSSDNTPVNLLGFREEDTVFASEHTNTTIAQAFAIRDLYPLGSGFTAVITDIPHGLTQGSQVRFSNINEFDTETNTLFSEGIGYSILPLNSNDLSTLVNTYNFNTALSSNGFKVALDIGSQRNQTYSESQNVNNTVELGDGFIGIRMTRFFPIITAVYPFTIGGNDFAAIEMDGIHGFEDGQVISIEDLSEFGGTTFQVSNLTAADISELQSSLDPNYDIFDSLTEFDRFFKIDIISGVSYQKFYRNVDVNLIELKVFPDTFSGSVKTGLRFQPNTSYLTMSDIVHTNEGLEILPLSASDLTFLQSQLALDPTLDTRVTFKVNQGSLSIGTNILGTIGPGRFTFIRTINKPVTLAGENYLFMTLTAPGIPLIDTDTVSTTPVENIFAKITLSATPGSIIFNSFISNPIIFENTPLSFLDELEFSFVNADNDLFEFNDTDHSFTLEFVEYKDKLMYNDYDSRRGRYDKLPVRMNFQDHDRIKNCV